MVSPHGRRGRYLRWQWRDDGVVAVPHRDGRFALVPMFRYPIGRVSLEFPRGAREPDEAATTAALRELREEAGLAGSEAVVVGRLHAETGLIESPVDVVRVDVPAGAECALSPEAMESVGAPWWLSGADIARHVGEGRITCGITLAALAIVLLA
ncbi:NUDIX hydrolase [Actinomadura sp. 3N508]|uniref:NUDIX hydrolase n=1 Tax=Actinomadura sp. 3N508 TaxID=3375153 RepID=UPI0037ADD0A9